MSSFSVAGAGSKKTTSRPRWTCQYISAVTPAPVPEASGSGSAHQQGKGKKGQQQKAPAQATQAEPEHLVRANTLAGYWELNRRAMKQAAVSAPPRTAGTGPSTSAVAAEDGASAGTVHPSVQISGDSLVGDSTRIGEKASVKKCVIGRHCNIGKGAKITGCILWDFVTVEEGARVENSILCSNVRIGEKAQIKDCEFGAGYEAPPNGTS